MKILSSGGDMQLHVRGAVGAVLLLILVAGLGLPASAQTTSRGTVTGTITDPTGAVVVNASVTITSVGTGVSRNSTSNSAGIYRFEAVDLGNYTATAQAPGFATMRKSGIEVQAARVLEVDFTLQVGEASVTVVVEASAAEVGLQTSEQVRGGHIAVHSISSLPVAGLDTLTLAQTVPGVLISGQGATQRNINQNGTFVYTANGQRPRGNSFLIDGVENNDISVTGPAYTITNPDAVEEVNIQTSNFSAEFGRAGGALFNQVTRSGTNSFHGTASYIYTGSAFKSLNFNQKVTGLTRPPRDIENIPSFSVGGPVYFPKLYDGRKKTFFFAAAQWDREYGRATANVTVPTDAGVAVLQPLAGSCPNVALYLQALGSLRGVSQFSDVSIAAPSPTGTCNGSPRTDQVVQTGRVSRTEPAVALDNNHQIRIDHVASNKQTMSWRWLYDKSSTAPGFNNLPGFDNANTAITLSMAFTDTYVISPRWTNEFRFNYGRIGFDFPSAAPDAFHANLANYAISGLTGFGVATNIPQFRFANNWQYSDTMSIVRGTHTFRFGADFLRQLARQHPPFNERGSLSFLPSGTTTALANFIDDFGGSSGRLNRLFGDSIYHPNLFRHSYFFQDSWKVRNDLVLNLGLRYENYGTPVNIFKIAAFTDYDPMNFAAPHKVNPSNKNFGPTVGFAWSPSGRLLGRNKTVIRGGYQISYDTWFNNLLSNIAGDSPNALSFTFVSNTSSAAARGTGGWGVLFAGTPAMPLTKATAQNSLFIKNMVNPYTQRWSLGFQREVPGSLIIDVSYVGSVSRKLFRSIDMNPVVNPATGDRLHPELQISTIASTRSGQGIRTVRASSANANYNSLQVEVRRRFAPTPLGNFAVNGSYTWGHSLDEISDVFGQLSSDSSFQSVSQVTGVSPRIDYGNSDFDYRHNGVIGWVWEIRGPKRGVFGQILGGWSLSGIQRFQTGFAFTVHNGTDRNGDGQALPDRPDIGNASAPLNTRATIFPACATGYRNPDAGNACVDPNSVHFIEGSGAPNARTVGRNTLRTPGLDLLSLNIAKTFRFSERMTLQYGLSMFNAYNTVNLNGVLAFPNSFRTVNGTSAKRFLDFTQVNSVGRSMRMLLKLNW